MDADDVVLVALINNPRDELIARHEHWYRIPAKNAPPHVAHARYVAFYLTSAFGERKWTIRDYAPIRGHELVRRRDLFPDEPDHPRADEAYYKLQIGNFIALPRPIVSRRGRRILFIWTNGDAFSRAVEINDLLGKSDVDDALWNALKRANIFGERHIAVREAQSRYRVDFWIECVCGNLAVMLGDARKLPKTKSWRVITVNESEIESPKSLTNIRKVIRELGGIKYNERGVET